MLDHASAIDASDNNVTLTGAQVTGSIIGRFDASDHLTLNAESGTTLSNLSAATLADPRVQALNAVDNEVTLTDAQVTDAIVGKFDPTDNLTLHASGATVAALSATTLADADVIHINVTGDNQVALYDDAGDHRITNEIIAKFDATDRLELNAENGATLAALDAATLSSDKVARLDAVIDNQVTLTDAKVTSTIVDKFVALEDHLTLNAPGETLSLLSVDALDRPNMTLHATSGAITFTAAQYQALDESGSDDSGSVIDQNDPFTITTDPSTNTLDLDGAGGGAATVVFAALPTTPDDIFHFNVLTDSLHFSKTAFNASDLPAAGVAIYTTQFFVATDVTGSGTEGTADTRFLYNNGSGVNTGDLFYDANGNLAGGVEHIATMQTATALTPDDIIMIA